MDSVRRIDPTMLGRLDQHPATGLLTSHEWTPGPLVADRLKGLMPIRLKQGTLPNGARCFAPAIGYEVFIQLSANAGLEILNVLTDLTPHQRRSYRDMLMIFQVGRHLNEHYGRGFRSAASLAIRRSRRSSEDERTVLPPGLGRAADGSGREWGITQLLSEGGEAARLLGSDVDNQPDLIAYGLYAAASRFPELEGDDSLVRNALFANFGLQLPVAEVVAEVEKRLLESIERRLARPDIEAFNKWCLNSRGTVIGQIARQKGGPGTLCNDDVRAAVLELTWRSYTYVAQCVHRQMRSFQWLLPDPLTEQEQDLFDLMFCQNETLFGLPLVLLAERFSLLRPCVVAIWQGQSAISVGPILRRMLWYYSWMVSQAREVDRRR